MCPVSVKVAHEAFKRGRHMTYFEALEMEYNLIIKIFENFPHNFLTAVSHKLIEKKKTRPMWIPESLSEVNDLLIQNFFVYDKKLLSNKL